jgi:hypothetical protein
MRKWDNKYEQSKAVYDLDGIATTQMAAAGTVGNNEVKIVAFRSRPPEDRHKNLVQEDEDRSDGLTNTITTVKNDNLLLENCNKEAHTDRVLAIDGME